MQCVISGREKEEESEGENNTANSDCAPLIVHEHLAVIVWMPAVRPHSLAANLELVVGIPTKE